MLAILQREVLTSLRRGTPYGLLAANAALLAALAMAVGALAGTISPWTAPAIGATSSPSPTGLGPTLVAWRGPVLFYVLLAWMTLVATVVAPLAGARAISAERESSTLDILIGSGVSPLGLVLGKAIGAGLQVALVIASGAPAFAMVWLFGGVGPCVVLLAVALLAAYAAFLLVLGLLLGTVLHGELAAAIVAGSLSGIILAGTLVGFLVGHIAAAGAISRGLALASPLVGLLAANGDLAEALVKALPGTPALPVHPTVELLGRQLGPLPFLSALFYGALSLALLSFAAAAVDPYHPLKTMGLRKK